MVQGLFKGGVYFVQLEPDNQYVGTIQGQEEFKEIWYIAVQMQNALFISSLVLPIGTGM